MSYYNVTVQGDFVAGGGGPQLQATGASNSGIVKKLKDIKMLLVAARCGVNEEA